MNARTIATILVCFEVVFAGCTGMNNGTGGNSADDGAAGDTTTASSDATTTSGDDGTTTQSATAEDESTATPEPMTTHATSSADEPTTGSETTTTDTTAGSGGGDSASVSNPFTEGDYFRIAIEVGTLTGMKEYVVEWRVLSVDGEKVTIKVTNPETNESETVQSDWNLIFLKLSRSSPFPRPAFTTLVPTLRSSVLVAQNHSLKMGSEWTITSSGLGVKTTTDYTVTGTDTVAGVNCEIINIGTNINSSIADTVESTACVNKDVFFALSYSYPMNTTLTVEEYHSGEEQ